MSSVLAIQQLNKFYGVRAVLKDLDFTVAKQTTVAVVGPNGAGKTTLLQILAGVVRASSGQVLIDGNPVPGKKARGLLSLAPQFLDFPVGVTVGEVIDFVLGHFPNSTEREHLYSAFGIYDLLKRPASELSGGEKKRVSLTMALAHQAPLTILDEPSAALDFRYQKAFLQIVDEMRGQRTIMFTTHDMSELRHLPNRVITLKQGQVVGDDLVESASTERTLKVVRFRSPSAVPNLSACLMQKAEGGVWRLFTYEPESLLSQLMQKSVAITDLEVYRCQDTQLAEENLA